MAPVDRYTAILFIVFLMFFLAVGIAPSWTRTAAKLRGLLQQRRALRQPGVAIDVAPTPTTYETSGQALQLNDFDIFILRRLAQAGPRGLSRRQLQAALHFTPTLVPSALAALQERGLVQMAAPIGLARRFRLSARGRDFAVAQGYLPQLRGG